MRNFNKLTIDFTKYPESLSRSQRDRFLEVITPLLKSYASDIYIVSDGETVELQEDNYNLKGFFEGDSFFVTQFKNSEFEDF